MGMGIVQNSINFLTAILLALACVYLGRLLSKPNKHKLLENKKKLKFPQPQTITHQGTESPVAEQNDSILL